MNTRSNSFALAALTLLAPLAAACGDAVDADAAPSPEQPVEVAELERDLPEPEETAPAVGEADARCRANLAQPFVGQQLDLDTRSELLDAVAPQVLIRFIEPGEAVTDDLNPERLNVSIGEDGAVAEVYCG